DQQRAGPVVAHEEDGSAALPGVVAGDDRALDLEVVGVTVGVGCPAAATTRGSGAGRVGAVADGLVAGHEAVQHGPGNPDAAQRPAVGANAATEGAVGHVHRTVLVLAERPDGRTAEVGPGGVATVPGKD